MPLPYTYGTADSSDVTDSLCLPQVFYLIGALRYQQLSRDQILERVAHSTSRFNSCCSRIWFCGSTNYFCNNETTKLLWMVAHPGRAGELA